MFDADEPERERAVLAAKSGEGVLGAAMLAREALRISDLKRDSRYSPRIEGTFPFERALRSLSLLEGERGALGAVGVFASDDGRGSATRTSGFCA